MSTLWVIGDSTVSSFEDKYYYPRYGYGTMLDKYLNDNVRVVNIALSGRSSKSYLSEPEYNTLINGMKQGDYLLIGFRDNDEKTEKERYTSPVGDYMTEGTFANSLYVNYIRKARNAGCYPILCTPIVRRSASGEWKATELHITQDVAQYKGGDYALAVRELGKAVGVPVIDMTQLTRDEYEKLGSDNTIYLHAWPSNNKLSVDNTHTNIWGARVNAYMIMSAVKELNISGLSENVVNIDNNPLDYKEEFLVSNKDYVPVVFSDKLPDSRLFQGRLGEEAELFDVPQQVAVGLVAAEVVLVVDEVVGDALHPAGHDAHIDAAQTAQLHLKAVHVLELAAVFFGDAGIVGQDDAHVVTAFVERLGQRAGHVGQSTRLDERHAFRCDKQDVLHVISSSHVKGARRFFFSSILQLAGEIKSHGSDYTIYSRFSPSILWNRAKEKPPAPPGAFGLEIQRYIR